MPRKLIMCGDHPVLAFEYEPASGRACSSGEVLDPRRLPLEFTTHGKSALYARRIDEWWKSRAIPSTRDGIRRVLDSLGASSTGELLDRTYGLSLSDQYWVELAAMLVLSQKMITLGLKRSPMMFFSPGANVNSVMVYCVSAIVRSLLVFLCCWLVSVG